MSEDPVLAAIARLGEQITQVRAETARLGEQVVRLGEQVAQSRAETARLIEGVQTSINAIRDDIAVIGAANDRTRRANDNTRDELRDISSSLANIERVLLKHGTRLDTLEQRHPPA